MFDVCHVSYPLCVAWRVLAVNRYRMLPSPLLMLIFCLIFVISYKSRQDELAFSRSSKHMLRLVIGFPSLDEFHVVDVHRPYLDPPPDLGVVHLHEDAGGFAVFAVLAASDFPSSRPAHPQIVVDGDFDSLPNKSLHVFVFH